MGRWQEQSTQSQRTKKKKKKRASGQSLFFSPSFILLFLLVLFSQVLLYGITFRLLCDSSRPGFSWVCVFGGLPGGAAVHAPRAPLADLGAREQVALHGHRLRAALQPWNRGREIMAVRGLMCDHNHTKEKRKKRKREKEKGRIKRR